MFRGQFPESGSRGCLPRSQPIGFRSCARCGTNRQKKKAFRGIGAKQPNLFLACPHTAEPGSHPPGKNLVFLPQSFVSPNRFLPLSESTKRKARVLPNPFRGLKETV